MSTSNNKTNGQTMFLDFYGLREQPFGVTPDPRFLYMTASHREALASLVYSIETKRGFSALIAEPGMGKTSLLFYLLDKIKPSARTAFLFRPDQNTKELLQSLLMDLGVEVASEDVPQMHDKLNSVLLNEMQSGKKFVWVLDEAQDLENEVLESVRLLSNFETPTSKLMHIVLAGQTALSDKLARPELVQLRQRVSTQVRLEPLSAPEVSEYIRHRTRLAGLRQGSLFKHEAEELIARESEGIPRNINTLCFLSLSLGFVEGCKEIEPSIVEEALADYESGRPKPVSSPPAAPAVPMAGELFDWRYSSPPPELPTSSGRWWAALGVFAFVVIPLLLIVLASDSRFSAGEEIVSKVTGMRLHLPDAPDTEPPSLQPPKPPEGLELQMKRGPVLGPISDDSTDVAILPHTNPSTRGRGIQAAAGKRSRLPSRVIDARGGETFSVVAFEYYGESNSEIVSQLREHNPQIRGLNPILKRGELVVLPDLAPRYQWKVRTSYAGRPSPRN
jgi:type II secretory pathway predicted ATPase ExeA/phage tail protein X